MIISTRYLCLHYEGERENVADFVFNYFLVIHEIKRNNGKLFDQNFRVTYIKYKCLENIEGRNTIAKIFPTTLISKNVLQLHQNCYILCKCKCLQKSAIDRF